MKPIPVGTLPLILCHSRPPIIICSSSLPYGHWTDLLSCIAPMTEPTCLIVLSSRAEQQHRLRRRQYGRYDVLMTPLNQEEVINVMEMARRYAQSDKEIHLRRSQKRALAAA
jgi:DNA-binding response OmpR family regulator